MPRGRKYSATPAVLERTIRAANGNIREAARALGWPESTVRLWLRRYGLDELAKRLRLEAAWAEFLEGLGPDRIC